MNKTRIFAGVARKGLPLVVLCALAFAAPGYCLQADVDRDIPSPSRGDIIFYADIVTFYEGGDRNIEEINCVVPNEQIRFVKKGDVYAARLKYTVKVADEDGRTVEATEKIISVSAPSADDAVDRTVVQVLQSKVTVAAGRYRIRVAIEDLNARKKTILSYLFRRYKTGEVETVVDSKQFESGQISISDIEFARGVTRTEEGVFQKPDYEIVPNAQRRYGKLLPELAVFYEVYDLRGAGRGDSVAATYSIVSREGNAMFTSETPLAPHGERFSAAAVFDVTALTGGSYSLDVTLRDRAGDVLATSTRKFDMVWSILSWGQYENEKIEDMAFILNEREMQEFKALSPGDQEKFLVDFWRHLDPTPETADNEAMLEHYRRISFSDQHYGTAGVRGAISDRGRIYIKYGPPDDVQSFYSDYEFIRDKRDMEGGTNPVLTDPFARVGIKAGQDATESEDDVLSDQRGGTTVHGKPYETWAYDGPGDPVRRLADRMASSAGMRFMFVDERGIGDYKMIYSSEKQEY